MFLLRIFIIFCVYLVISINANPCRNAPANQDINICDKGTRDEDPNNRNVVIRADTINNCTCELSIIGQTSKHDVVIGRYGNYTSSHPGIKSGCGVLIDFFANTDLFYQAHCSMSSIKRFLLVNQKLFVKSQTASGILQEGSGYCIEIINERLKEENGRLHLKCGLPDDLSTNPSQTTTAINQSTSIMMSTTHDSSVLVSTDNESSSSNNSFVPFLTNNSESSSSITIAVGVSFGLLAVLLCIVTSIFVVIKSRKCQCHKKTSTVEQHVYDLFTSERDREDSLQYDILNNKNIGYQSDNHTLNISNRDHVFETQLQNTMTSSELNTENKAADQTVIDGNVYDNLDSAPNKENNYVNL